MRGPLGSYSYAERRIQGKRWLSSLWKGATKSQRFVVPEDVLKNLAAMALA